MSNHVYRVKIWPKDLGEPVVCTWISPVACTEAEMLIQLNEFYAGRRVEVEVGAEGGSVSADGEQ